MNQSLCVGQVYWIQNKKRGDLGTPEIQAEGKIYFSATCLSLTLKISGTKPLLTLFFRPLFIIACSFPCRFPIEKENHSVFVQGIVLLKNIDIFISIKIIDCVTKTFQYLRYLMRFFLNFANISNYLLQKETNVKIGKTSL